VTELLWVVGYFAIVLAALLLVDWLMNRDRWPTNPPE
jgi:hypothetical protein